MQGKTLRGQQRARVFKPDARDATCRVVWEPLRGQSGQEPRLIQQLQEATQAFVKASVRPPTPGNPGSIEGKPETVIAVGLRSVERAVKKGNALAVLVCTEGVPQLLMQHIPVICALADVPVAVLAVAPSILARAVSPLSEVRVTRGGSRSSAMTLAMLTACEKIPELASFCRDVRISVPAPKLPFLMPRDSLGVVKQGRTPGPVSRNAAAGVASSASTQAKVAPPKAEGIIPLRPPSLFDLMLNAKASKEQSSSKRLSIGDIDQLAKRGRYFGGTSSAPESSRCSIKVEDNGKTNLSAHQPQPAPKIDKSGNAQAKAPAVDIYTFFEGCE